MANRCTEVLESPKAQLMADDGLVAPAPRRSWDWSSTIELLARANEGQLLQVEVPDGVPAQHVQSNLRQIAFRRGFSIKSRHMDGVLYVWRSELRPIRRGLVDRNNEICSLIASGNTFEAVGRQFGLSRQRIEQIYSGYAKFTSLPIEKRVAAANEFIAPFVEKAVCCGRRCILCKHEMAEGQKLRNGVCPSCANQIRILQLIKSRLKCWHSNPDTQRQQLRNATYLIRKHGVKPEDLELV